MIGFPFWNDQFTNSKLMADEWKIGLRLSGVQGAEKEVILRKDISSAVRKLLSDEGMEVKRNVEALRDSARTAVRRGGSSDRNIERFIEGLKEKRTSK